MLDFNLVRVARACRLALGAALLPLLLTACGDDKPKPTTTPGAPPAAATVTVEIKDSAYHPETVRIRVGETVKWVNRDAMGHSATRDAADPRFDTGVLSPQAESAAIRFDTASDATGWQYRCKVTGHGDMKGFVVVTK